jgi:hypothetical protein
MIARVHASVPVHHGADETCQVCARVRLGQNTCPPQSAQGAQRFLEIFLSELRDLCGEMPPMRHVRSRPAG